MFLELIKPVSYIGSQMTLAFGGPFLSVFGYVGVDYIKFFEKPENPERLLQKIEEEVKVRDEESKKAKEQGKLLKQKFGFRVDLLPGFSLREEAPYGTTTSLIGIMRKESAGGGFLAISFSMADSTPPDFLYELSMSLSKEDMRKELMLSQDMLLSMQGNEQDFGKIGGHKTSRVSYLWSGMGGKNGIVECYGLRCDKTRRIFVLGMRTAALTGQKSEKSQVQELRYVLGSLRCH